MLLLDKNTNPTHTVYYLSAVAHKILSSQPYIDVSSLYRIIEEKVIFGEFNFEFLVLALDFLFLLDKVEINEKGELHVH